MDFNSSVRNSVTKVALSGKSASECPKLPCYHGITGKITVLRQRCALVRSNIHGSLVTIFRDESVNSVTFSELNSVATLLFSVCF